MQNTEHSVIDSGETAGKLAFCTIATSEYLARAKACLLSIHEQHEGATCVLLLVRAGPAAPVLPPEIEVLRLEDCIAPDRLSVMRESYSVAELCFAAKPFLIKSLLARDVDQVHYFDADCLVFGGLAPLIFQLGAADLLLTPHSLSPIPDDGCSPRPLTILRAGAFNAGYVGVRNSTQGVDFANWHAAMTSKYSRNAPKEGMCGDQKWLDLAPALFPGMAICRHPGANVAYWNLHERSLSSDPQGGFEVNGTSLLFFHFSGYDPLLPMQLSKYQNRHGLHAGSPLHQLLQIYGSRIAAAAPSAGQGESFVKRTLRHFASRQAMIAAVDPTERKDE